MRKYIVQFDRVENKYLYVMSIVFVLTHFQLLLSGGIFWDDWLIHDQTWEGLNQAFFANGNPWLAYFHQFLTSVSSIGRAHRLITFLSYAFAMFFLYKSIKLSDFFSDQNAFFITILMITVPYFSARTMMILSPYVVYFLFFSLGFYLFMLVALRRASFAIRLLALVFLGLSFFYEAFIPVFLGLQFFILQFRTETQPRKMQNILRYNLKYLDFYILGLLVFLFKSNFFQPHGHYENYNEINLKNAFSLITKLATILEENFFKLFSVDNSVLVLIMGFVFLGTNYIIFKSAGYTSETSRKNSTKFLWSVLIFGFSIFIIALVPHLLVGKMPLMMTSRSRGQMLLILGSSFILWSLIYQLVNPKYRNKVMIIVISFFMAKSNGNYLSYQREWIKQVGLMEQLKDNEIIRNNSTFILDDRTFEYNASGPLIARYAYWGMFKKVYNDQSRMAFRKEDSDDLSMFLNNLSEFKIRLQPVRVMYNVKDYTPGEIKHVIIIEEGAKKISFYHAFKMYFLQFYDPIEFNHQCSKTITIKTHKIQCLDDLLI